VGACSAEWEETVPHGTSIKIIDIIEQFEKDGKIETIRFFIFCLFLVEV
jgi:uncharacterized membrane protein